MSYDPTGEQGPTGATGATGTEYNSRGSYYYSTSVPPSYLKDDLVVNNNQVVDNLSTPLNTPDNNTYVCIQSLANPYGAPGPLDPNVPEWVDYWQLFVNGGATGATGATGEAGPTGATGGDGTAQGITGSIQFNDGSGGFTGSSGFLWTETGGMGNAYRLTGGLNGNFIDLDVDQNMAISIGGDVQDMGKGVLINASSSSITLTDRTVPELTDSQISIGSDELAINIGGTNGTTGQYLGSDGAGFVTWSTPQGGLQYILTGSTVGGTITNLPNATVWTTLTWTLASTISFIVPPNWSAGNFVSFDGLALYDFNINNVNYWSVYYTTTSQATEQPLLGSKNILNAIINSSPQMYFPMNLLIPTTYLEAGGTINLRVYGFTNGTTVQFAQTPVINARVSVVLD